MSCHVKCRAVLLLSAVFAAAACAGAETVKVANCIRNADLDYWAAADARFCRKVMDCVFNDAGLTAETVAFDSENMMVVSNAEVICSVFRNPDILENYNFPIQPLGYMHYALYAMPNHAIAMMSTKISDWPRMRVGYSPVSQGQNQDRQNYFKHAQLNPQYVEYPTSVGAVQALHDGEIDALFLYTPFNKRPEGLVEVVPIGSRNVYFAVRKDKPELFEMLRHAYRRHYIDHIDHIDKWREELLGVPPPKKRVRIAAYSRGDLFEVTPDGDRTGALENWVKALCSHTHWTPDYVYGDYDESIEDVKSGRLDIIGGLGFTTMRRDSFLYPHTPIGMMRVYLWAHRDSPYQPGSPSTWKGMRVGMLSGAVSSERAKRQFNDGEYGVKYVEYHADRDMINAYFKGDIDACIDVEMPKLANEKALHLYASHPMYICVSPKSRGVFDELEIALDKVCDDFPKYMRMISEHHYGIRNEMAALTMKEAEWLRRRLNSKTPVEIDFSPWPYKIFDGHGHLTGIVAAFLTELSRKTGLKFTAQEQTGILSAEAKFLRGETMLWIPFPAVAKEASYTGTTVFSLPVPQSVCELYGAGNDYVEFEMFASRNVPEELVSILRKAATGIDSNYLQEMFMRIAAERKVTHRVFGMTKEELTHVIAVVASCILLAVILFGSVMIALLMRQTRRAHEAADRAEEHAQARTRFLAMMSHELRTPLNAVIGFAEFLSDRGLGEEKRREYVDGIMLSSNALLDLINDVLDLSKLEAGAMDMRDGTCDVWRLLKELPAIFGYRVRRHGVKLRIDAPLQEHLPVIKLAHQGLRQVLINLVGNSAKFTEHGEIVVKAEWDGETRNLHLEVRDTGCGISQEKLDKLFDPFVQDIATRMQSSAGEIKGTGLGLPIVKRMVDNAGGSINAMSELGKGTTFVIDIPNLDVVETADTENRSAENFVLQIVPERVLVVDDMVMNRKILGIHLGKIGVADIRYAENGQKALEVMREWLPDIVLTDMWMPIMDGTQLAEAMHRDRRCAEIPIVAVTADIDVGSTYDMSLFVRVMSKPVTGAKLKALFGDIASASAS